LRIVRFTYISWLFCYWIAQSINESSFHLVYLFKKEKSVHDT
jgi:hypothetical protein